MPINDLGYPLYKDQLDHIGTEPRNTISIYRPEQLIEEYRKLLEKYNDLQGHFDKLQKAFSKLLLSHEKLINLLWRQR